jgi:hypothetical protein
MISMITRHKLTKTLIWGGIPLALVLGASTLWFVYRPFLPAANQPAANSLDSPLFQADPFRDGVNRAMSAAELTQTANSPEEWGLVAGLWQEAINLMENVPNSSEQYAVAQQKMQEYPDNLKYAQQKAEELEAAQTQERRSQIQQGEDLLQQVRGEYQVVGLLSGTPMIQMVIPETEWDGLSKEEQVNLTVYAEHLVEIVRSSPDSHVGVPSSAPIYAQFVSKASRLCTDCWQVVLGKPLGTGTFLTGHPVVQGDETWDQDDPCCRGERASEFRS